MAEPPSPRPDEAGRGGAQPEIATSSQTPAPEATGLQAPATGPRRAAVIFIFITVALDMLSVGMITPVLPGLVRSLVHAPAGDVTAEASRMLGVFGTVFAAMQFFFSPVIGSLSDRWGRRPLVLLSNFGLGLDYVLMAWAPSLGWLLVGRILSGITTSSVPTAQAYIADVTPPEKRAASFGVLASAFAVGFVMGPAIGGMLGDISPRLPFWVSAGLSLLNGLYGLSVLPESLKDEHRAPFSWKRANPIGSLHMLFRSRTMLSLAAVLLVCYVAQQSLVNVYVLYTDYRFHWTDKQVGLSLALVGIVSGLYGGGLVKRAVKAMGERGSMLMGMALGLAGFLMFGFSKTGALLLWGIPLMNGMSFVWPSAQSLMTRSAAPNEQGQLQGAIQSIRGISGLIGPGLFTWIFAQTVGAHAIIHLPGSPFFLASALLLAALLLAAAVVPRHDAATV